MASVVKDYVYGFKPDHRARNYGHFAAPRLKDIMAIVKAISEGSGETADYSPKLTCNGRRLWLKNTGQTD